MSAEHIVPAARLTRGRIRIADVARLAGVSIKTVSRVLNDAPNVRADTRETVRRAMSDLDYVADIHARRLAGHRLQMVGVVVPSFAAVYSYYLYEIVHGAVEEAEGRDYRTIIMPSSGRVSNPDTYVRFLREGFVDGLVIILRPSNLPETAELARSGLPAVAIDDGVLGTSLPVVITDNRAAAFAAVEHLIHLGHLRIAHIAGDPAFGCTAEREAGYRDAMLGHGLSTHLRVLPGDHARSTGRRLAEVLFESHEPPTAIFCACDDTAQGAIDAAHGRGLQVGRDISIVGFNDANIARESNPPLTTVRQPLQEFGRLAFRILLERMEQGVAVKTHHVLPSSLVVRSSCGAPITATPEPESVRVG